MPDDVIECITPTILQITEPQLLACTQPDCSSTFSNAGQLAMHLSQHHRVASPASSSKRTRHYFCPIDTCKYHYHQPSRIQPHPTGGARPPATHTRHFTAMKLLKQHYIKVHAVRTLRCPKCPRTFSADRLMRAHQLHCGRKFRCVTCSWEYQSNEALQTHCRRKMHEMPAAVGRSIVTKTPEAMPLRRLRPLAPKPMEVAMVWQPSTTKVSQTTQTNAAAVQQCTSAIDSLFLDNWRKRATDSAAAAQTPPLPAVHTNHCSVQTDINLNNLHFPTHTTMADHHQSTADGDHLCHIETQTDFERVATIMDQADVTARSAAPTSSRNGDISPVMLYTDGHTQTHCDELMFGWTHIETQTCWSPNPHVSEDFAEFLVSTETQTSLPPAAND